MRNDALTEAGNRFQATVGHLDNNTFSSDQLALIRDFVKVARGKGILTRLWELPSWPVDLRNYVW